MDAPVALSLNLLSCIVPADLPKSVVCGPPSVAQLSAVRRLPAAAVAFVRQFPEVLTPHDLDAKLQKRRVAYDGDMRYHHWGVAGSLPSLDLCTRASRQALAAPDEVMLPAARLARKPRRAKMRAALQPTSKSFTSSTHRSQPTRSPSTEVAAFV